MSKQLRELQARKASLVKDARQLMDIAVSEERDLNDQELEAFEVLKAKIEATSAAIDREADLIAEEAKMAHVAHTNHGADLYLPVKAKVSPMISVSDNRELDPTHGFKSVGEFLKTVCHAQKPGAAIDERLLIGTSRSAAVPANFGS